MLHQFKPLLCLVRLDLPGRLTIIHPSSSASVTHGLGPFSSAATSSTSPNSRLLRRWNMTACVVKYRWCRCFWCPKTTIAALLKLYLITNQLLVFFLNWSPLLDLGSMNRNRQAFSANVRFHLVWSKGLKREGKERDLSTQLLKKRASVKREVSDVGLISCSLVKVYFLL